MADAARHDVWAQGAAYERYIGRWSRPVAAAFVDWLAVPPGRTWLDVGCGTGALARCILDTAAPEKVVGIDSSADFVAHADAQVGDPRAAFRVADACALPWPDREFDAVVSGLVLNFVPDQPGAVAEMRRVARPGGTVAAYVWDYGEGMQLIRRFWDAATALDPAARDLDEASRFPLCRPAPLRALFEGAGLRDVSVAPIDVPTAFADFDDYWSPFLGGQGPAPGYCTKLPDSAREALRDRLRSSLPTERDGTIRLIARAWAAKATV